ncbi:MAG: RNA-binding protein [Candidatus Omnitrophica bacterium]|nr:RNA-binding protein [Candidatus Omnitrophota bacterium]
MNIYIGNFSYDITEEELKSAFNQFGQVETAKIIKDKFSGTSRGFGFVEMPNHNEAMAAMGGITEIKGKRITINEAKPMVSYADSAKNNDGNSERPTYRNGWR